MATTTSNDLPDNLSTVLQSNTQTGTTTSSTSTSTSTSSSITSTTASFSSGTTINNAPSDLPTIAGAGIPTMVVPYTANAPFMQKSDYPEGTVFIAVGAVLAFFGACILLWRGLVAWSINRSVRRSAMASVRSSEKHPSTWGGSGYAPVKDGFYKEVGSSMSMDALNHAGKPLKGYRDNDIQRSATPPAGLFFSPTAQAGQGGAPHTRASSYLPAGYYATSSAQPAGGAGITTVGAAARGPFARTSRIESSPPDSPNLRPMTHGSSYRATSRDGLRGVSRDGYSSSRNSHFDHPRRPLNDSPAGSRAGSRAPSIAGDRAPSAYLDDLFENHGHGPRERF